MHTWVHQQQLKPARTWAGFMHTRRRLRTSAVAVSATPAAAPQETSAEKWSVQAMRCGMATAQGPRETMEDAAQVALYAPCGYLYSCK